GPLSRCFGGLALAVVGVGLDAPGDGETVDFPSVHGERHGLGRLTEGNRQAAGRQGVERAGMAGFTGRENPFHPRQGLGRGHALGLVEDEPAMDIALFRARRLLLNGRVVHSPFSRSPFFTSRRTSGLSSSASIFAPESKLVSTRK